MISIFYIDLFSQLFQYIVSPTFRIIFTGDLILLVYLISVLACNI